MPQIASGYKGQLTKDQVAQIADEIFEELHGFNNWDRRRILWRVERQSKKNPVKAAA